MIDPATPLRLLVKKGSVDDHDDDDDGEEESENEKLGNYGKHYTR